MNFSKKYYIYLLIVISFLLSCKAGDCGCPMY